MTVKYRERIVKMYEEGQVSDEFLKLYAISGPVPLEEDYINMSLDERESFWHSRVVSNLGENWQDILGPMRDFYKKGNISWSIEGF